MTQIQVLAPAKLNLALDITGVRPDGYHLLDTVMLAVDLCDTLTLTLREDEQVEVRCDRPEVPQGSGNIAHRAAGAFFEHTGLSPRGLTVAIRKRIPMQAGLAGGSADAAGVLVGLNALFGAGLPTGELERIALELGADLPFCVRGGCARACGIGERLEPLPLPEGAWFAIAKPSEGVDTGAAFRRYDARQGAAARPDMAAMAAAVRAGDLSRIGAAMANVFEALSGLESVKRLVERMRELGALGAAMTGSGSAVIGLFDNEDAARHCAERLAEPVSEVFVARPLAHGAKILPGATA